MLLQLRSICNCNYLMEEIQGSKIKINRELIFFILPWRSFNFQDIVY